MGRHFHSAHQRRGFQTLQLLLVLPVLAILFAAGLSYGRVFMLRAALTHAAVVGRSRSWKGGRYPGRPPIRQPRDGHAWDSNYRRPRLGHQARARRRNRDCLRLWRSECRVHLAFRASSRTKSGLPCRSRWMRRKQMGKGPSRLVQCLGVYTQRKTDVHRIAGKSGGENSMKLFRKLWADEAGFIISAELVLVATIVVIGLIVGLTVLRNSIVQELIDASQAVAAIDGNNDNATAPTTPSGLSIVAWPAGAPSAPSGGESN